MSAEQKAMLAELEALRAENKNLKTKIPTGSIGFKVSQKGAVSIYGLGRFPVTLYSSQVERLAKAIPALLKFVEDNKDRLTVKTTVAPTPAE